MMLKPLDRSWYETATAEQVRELYPHCVDKTLTSFATDLPGGDQLRVLISIDPVNDHGDRRRHVSASVGRSPFSVGAYRRPTDAEMADVKTRFERPGNPLVEDRDRDDPFVRHLWEQSA